MKRGPSFDDIRHEREAHDAYGPEAMRKLEEYLNEVHAEDIANNTTGTVAEE